MMPISCCGMYNIEHGWMPKFKLNLDCYQEAATLLHYASVTYNVYILYLAVLVIGNCCISTSMNHQRQPSGSDMPPATHTSPDEEEEGGYDYDYAERPPFNLVCIICHCPARDPIQTNNCCGSTFCKECITKYLKPSVIDNSGCPCCKKENFTYIQDKRAEREIGNLKMYCRRKSEGCSWVGELRLYKEHINNNVSSTAPCQYVIVQCSNQCGAEMQRRLLDNHLKTECEERQVKCQYCNNTGKYKWIGGNHLQGCPKYPIECPNHCEVGYVNRDEMSAHLEVCSLAIVKCPFAPVGCDSVVRRKDLTEHLETSTTFHMNYMLRSITSLNSEVQTSLESLSQAVYKLQSAADNKQFTNRSELDNFKYDLSLTLNKIGEVKSGLDSHDGEMSSLFDNERSTQEIIGSRMACYSSELNSVKQSIAQNNYQLHLEIQSSQQTAAQQIQDIKQAVNDTQTMCKTGLCDIKQDLTDFRSEVSQNLSDVKQNWNDTFAKQKAGVDDAKKGFEDFKRDFQTYKEEIQTLKHEQKADGAKASEQQQPEELLQQKLHQEVTQQASEVNNFDKKLAVLVQLQGWHIQLNYHVTVCIKILPNVYLRMTDFTEFKAAKKVWHSPPFYTDNKGYKMCLSVSTHHNTSYVSIQLSLMRGEHDNQLHWPFKGTLQLQMMNQRSNDNHTTPVEVVFDGSDESSSCQRVMDGERNNFENYAKLVHFRSLSEGLKSMVHLIKDDSLIFRILTFLE